MTIIGGTLNYTTESINSLFRFHALGLLPPPTRNVTGLPNGYDFLQNSTNVYTFNSSSPNFSIKSSIDGGILCKAFFALLQKSTHLAQLLPS